MNEQRLNLLLVLGLQLLPPFIIAAIALFGKWLLGLWTTESVSYLGLLLGGVALWYWLPRMQKKVRALNRERYALRHSRAGTSSTH